MSDLKHLIRTIPDLSQARHPVRDVTTLFGDAQGFKAAIAQLAEPYRTQPIDAVAGIEARGFILGGAVADRLGCGFIPVRKKGKLPWKNDWAGLCARIRNDVIEIHEDAVKHGQRVLIVDDLIATGGTAEAAIKLVRRCHGHVMGACFIIDLPDHGGKAKLEAENVPCHAVDGLRGSLMALNAEALRLALERIQSFRADPESDIRARVARPRGFVSKTGRPALRRVWYHLSCGPAGSTRPSISRSGRPSWGSYD